MASIKLKGDTSGEITISAPAVAGTNTLTIPAVTGNILTDGAALPAIDGSALTGITTGKVLQVIQTVKSDTFSTSSSTFTDITGMSATITPSSTSSKILVVVSFGTLGHSSTVSSAYRLMRGATPVGVGNAVGSRPQASMKATYTSSTTHADGGHTFHYLDSPSTTSATTYKVQMGVQGGGFSVRINGTWAYSDGSDPLYATTMSSITLMEIAG
jgi:hypothetical protein